MRISNLIPWLALALAGVTSADKLTLASDARLTGTVRSIHESGVVELASDLSPEPLLLKAGAVEKVEFTAPESPPDPAGTLIELTNGDLLPATLESLDDTHLSVTTGDTGHITIPRTALKSMQLGVHKRKASYTGPKNAEEWSHDVDEAKHWNFSNNALVANGPAQGARDLELPRQFILKFSLKWQANPNFQIYFADPLTPQVEAVDRYYMQFNGAGLEIKRESSNGKRFQTVILLARTPDQFANRQMDVEIRVDRKASRLHLLLNGEPEGAGVDPSAEAPEGGGVALVNSAATGLSQEIRGIEVLELDNVRTRHRSEERGDLKNDSLISRDEDRWSGRLIGIHKKPAGVMFSFKSDFQEEALELSDADVSTVFFAQAEPQPTPDKDQSFSLRLSGEGSLRVSSCTFSGDSVSSLHPLLGPLKIKRAGVVAIERLDSKSETKAEE